MTGSTPGLHHVAALARDAQRNLDFYCGLLGLRLLKATVDYEDPTSYHLYYGGAAGGPGSVLAFLIRTSASAGRLGTGEAAAVALRVPDGALPAWQERLEAHGVHCRSGLRFGQPLLLFRDPDGLRIELTAAGGAAGEPSDSAPVAADHALQELSAVTFWLPRLEPSLPLLAALGFEQAAAEGEGEGRRCRFEVPGGRAATLDFLVREHLPPGAVGAGSIHHTAFRAPDERRQRDLLAALEGLGTRCSPVEDRGYFRTAYFRGPGGSLLEVATDGPGFEVDEPREELGSSLRLPARLESRRAEIEAGLPPLRHPLTGALINAGGAAARA